ncbi:MAG: DNA gyrase subunit A [Pseudomonadota bacterium]
MLITDEMRTSYLDYAMSVIVSRALPDVRDGLKPVHRRILYAMGGLGFDWNKPYKKCARAVGEVIGKYHPHGEGAVYDALVRMAQDFSMRVPLIDGQGNFGSVDGDPPAAMRYTESRLSRISMSLLDDLDKDTVDFRENYDGSETEPVVLPAKFPNLLVNGAGGIAVGMATNIPPHNLGEVIDGCMALLDEPELTVEDLMNFIPGPDFPTGAQILGRAGIRAAYHKGRGSIVQRARVHTETVRKDREALIVTEIPYQVNKRVLIEKIADMVRDKRLEGVSNIWDESSREGMRIVIELKRDAVADVVLNQLWRFSQLQQSFGANMVVLNGGKPEQLDLRDILMAFLTFREEVITRRIKFLLNKARDRAHVLLGLAIAVANIDEVIHLIRHAPNPAAAREGLMARDWPAGDIEPLVRLVADPRSMVKDDGTYRLSLEQAQAILDLRLQRLTALGRDEIGEELQKLADQIKDYLDILSSRARVVDIIKGELTEIKDRFATPRMTEITEFDGDLDDEDLIEREDMVVTVSHKGYIKRVPLSTYRAQRRGGKGRSGMSTRDEDFVVKLFVANTHTPVLFFSSRGMAYKLKVWRLPVGTPTSLGKALINILPLQEGETITTIMPLPEDEATWADLNIMFATTAGTVRRNNLSDFTQINRNGKIAMKLDDDERDQIVGVEICTEDDDVMLTASNGNCIRFNVTDVRVFASRNSTGVRGVALADGATLIGMTILRHVAADAAERAAYLKQAAQMRRALIDDGDGVEVDDVADTVEAEEGSDAAFELPPERYAELSAKEQFLLTLSRNGYGKRSSAYEYRVTGRGGKGIVAMVVNDRNGPLVANFPVEDTDQIMLVTSGGQLIRCPVDGIRVAGRNTQGVTVFNTGGSSQVVIVEHIPDDGSDAGDDDDEAPDTAPQAE